MFESASSRIKSGDILGTLHMDDPRVNGGCRDSLDFNLI